MLSKFVENSNTKELSIMEQSYKEVWKYIYDIKKSLEESNRFFSQNHNDFLENLKWIFENCSNVIQPKNILYRGRIYNVEDKYEKYHNPEKYEGDVFMGYDKKGSFINLNNQWPQEGRMNPHGIKCLYTAKDIDTCITELNPGYEELISIAEIEVKENLKIVDLSTSFAIGNTSDKFKIDLSMYIQKLI
jgi:copper chaperone CopZ